MAASCSKDARQGTLHRKRTWQAQRKDRFQRGKAFYRCLLADIARAVDTWSALDKKPHPVLFVDMTAWSGDSAAACGPQSTVDSTAKSLSTIAITPPCLRS